jgi:hypothetical protein
MLLLQAFVGPEGLTASTSVEMRKHSSRSLNGLKCPTAMCFARPALVGSSSLRAAKLTTSHFKNVRLASKAMLLGQDSHSKGYEP